MLTAVVVSMNTFTGQFADCALNKTVRLETHRCQRPAILSKQWD